VIARRAFLAGLGGAFIAPLAAEAQPASKPVRIGVLTPQSREVSASRWEAFRQGLRDLGWEDGRNIIIEARFADGTLERLRPLAEELVKLGVSVIVAANTPGTRAAMDATTSIPIVMVEVADPVATGFVKDLARPRGNVTGVSTLARETTRKRLEFLKEAVPRASRIAVIMNPDDPVTAPQWRDTQEAAVLLGLQLQRLAVRNAIDLERAVQSAVAGKADAVIRLVDPVGVVLGRRTAELLTTHRLPAMLTFKTEVESGALMVVLRRPS
jgi:putative ABC transport system substrate-binding protein